jgi:23S rRNA pseudouridine1911/1915/1917 synthase
MKKINTYTTVEEPEAEGIRADRYISDYMELLPRSQLKHRKVEIEINGKKAKLSKALRMGDELVVYYLPKEDISIEAEQIPLDIIYENSRCIVLNKPQGMVVHPGAGNYSGTLVHALLAYVPQLKTNFPEYPLRPGIVHRLDKDTSGIMVAAKDPDAMHFLSLQFSKKSIIKQYLAVVKGVLQKPHGSVNHPIARDAHNRKKFTWKHSDGKEAYTEYRVLRHFENSSFVLLSPSTGRTHQLRVHMSSLGHPIIGDPLYGRTGGSFKSYSLLLHAYKLILRLPGEMDSRVFRAHLPEHLKCALRSLR